MNAYYTQLKLRKMQRVLRVPVGVDIEVLVGAAGGELHVAWLAEVQRDLGAWGVLDLTVDIEKLSSVQLKGEFGISRLLGVASVSVDGQARQRGEGSGQAELDASGGGGTAIPALLLLAEGSLGGDLQANVKISLNTQNI